MRDLVVFDCDGVIYRGTQRLPHVRETFRLLRRHNIPVRFITNNSTLTRKDFLAKLRVMEIDASLEEIQSSARATALYLQQNARPGAAVYVLGERGIREELRALGFRALHGPNWRGAKYVVVGMDRRFTYNKLAAALSAVHAGAMLIATNRDPTFPLEGGAIAPGGGAMVAAIEAAAGCEALLIGKPRPLMLEQVLAEAGVRPERTLMVGDRATTDVLAGRNAGMKTLLVLGGVTQASDLPALPPPMQPHFIAEDIRGALSALGLKSSLEAVRWNDFIAAGAKMPAARRGGKKQFI